MIKRLVLCAEALGGLRLLLFALAAGVVVVAPEPEMRTVITWPLIVPTLIAPAVAPLVFVVVLLDLMMAKIMSSGVADKSQQVRARRVMFIDVIVAGILAYAYLPFFLALGR